MPETDVDGTTLYYETVGSAPEGAPTCLVVNGWAGVDHTYLRSSGLDRLGERLRLVYYDQRGTGRSGRLPVDADPLTVEQLADDAAALLGTVAAGPSGPTERGVQRPAIVFGHYHGSFVAQELALRHPSAVAGLVLVSATPGELGTTEDLGALIDVPPLPVEVDILQRVPPATDDEWAATMIALAPWFFHRAGGHDPQAVFAGAMFDAETVRQWMLTIGFWSAVDRLGGLSVPTLVVAGSHDVFAPPQQAERIRRRVPGAEVVVLEESGHLPWLEEPDAFAAAVEQWVQGPG